MADFYAEYAAWFARMYGRPYDVTRKQWNDWCRQEPARPLTDDEFDDQKEREGDR